VTHSSPLLGLNLCRVLQEKKSLDGKTSEMQIETKCIRLNQCSFLSEKLFFLGLFLSYDSQPLCNRVQYARKECCACEHHECC